METKPIPRSLQLLQQPLRALGSLAVDIVQRKLDHVESRHLQSREDRLRLMGADAHMLDITGVPHLLESMIGAAGAHDLLEHGQRQHVVQRIDVDGVDAEVAQALANLLERLGLLALVGAGAQHHLIALTPRTARPILFSESRYMREV